MGILDFEIFNAGHMLNKAVKNPDQMLLGAADPFGAKLWGSITGKEYSPIVNEWGGATEDAYKAAEEKGISTGAARGAHKVAQTVAGLYAGGAAANGLSGIGSTGNAAQGLSGGSSGLGLGSSSQGLKMGAGNGVQLSRAGTPAATTGLFSQDNLKTANDVAGLAGKMGIFDDPQAPPAPQSAGIPSRQADFTGLLSAGKSNNVAGAQKLMQQQMMRKQGRL